MRIGILTGGGDCPGLNPAIRGCTMRSLDFGWEVLGINDGWKGLIEGLSEPLSLPKVEELMDKGGTILGTSRTNPYKIENGVQKILENVKRMKLDGLVAIGGDDTLGVANRLYKEHQLKVAGVPKTMDNDLSATDCTIGFDTAVTRGIEALEILKDTGRSHHRIMVLEVMGRHAGWVALYTAIGGGADWVLIPEEEVDVDQMCERLKKVYSRKRTATVVVSEGVKVPGMIIGREETDQFGRVLLKERGIGGQIAAIIRKKLGVEVRVGVIGHMQRGGAPTLFDRLLGIRTGAKAAELVRDGKFGYMASLVGNEIKEVKLEDAVKELKTVPRSWINFAKTFFGR